MNGICCTILIILCTSILLPQAVAVDTPNDMVVNKTDKSLTLIDEMGRTVTVNLPVKRIISVDYTQMDALLAIGARDMIVGVDSNFHKAMPYFGLKDLPEVGKHAAELNYEQLAMLDPDLIMLPLWQGGKAKEILQNLPNATVVVMGLNYRDELIPELQIMGQLLGKEDEAEKLIEWIQKYDDIVEERTKDLSSDEMPTFYYDYMSDLNTKWTALTPYSQYGGRVAEGCGGRNIASDFELNITKSDVGAEWVFVHNPDFIFLDFMGSEKAGAGKTEDDVKNAITKIIDDRTSDGFGNYTATKNNHIYAIQQDFVCGPRWVIGHICFAKWLHPELFTDLSIDEINQGYLKEFHNMELDGTWAYPVPV